jgi:RimJ/RimL family protein N-acetyltransferase
MWCVEVNSTGERIGICGLLKRDELDDVDVGFSFLAPFRGCGYAIEAAAASLQFGWQEAKLARIVAIVSPHNERSIRLVEKLGMRFERMARLNANSREVMLFAIDRPAADAMPPAT